MKEENSKGVFLFLCDTKTQCGVVYKISVMFYNEFTSFEAKGAP